MTSQLPFDAANCGRTERAGGKGPSRRSFLYTTTALFGAAGAIAAAWPFFNQMNPDAATRALRDELVVDVAELKSGEQRIVRWRTFPIVIVCRIEAALAWLHEHPAGLQPAGPNLVLRRQPSSAENFSRSIEPRYGVFASICSWCGCTPLMQATAIEPDVVGGFVCPCCVSRFDAAGRPTYGPAQNDLLVPPYAYEETRIVIGKHVFGEPIPAEFFDKNG